MVELCSLNNAPVWLAKIQRFLIEWNNDDLKLKVNSSGSTGKPKSIDLRKCDMVRSAEITIAYFGLKAGMKSILCLPIKYIAGKMMLVRAIVANMDLLLIEPSSNPLKGITEKVDFIALTPFQIDQVLDHSPEKLRLISTVILGGGSISNKIRHELSECSAKCYLTYGMTETITHIAIQQLNALGKPPVFTLLNGFEISVDPRSCLVIKADHIYQKKVVTNDIVEIIDTKNFRWIGRWDNVINTGGVKVFPEIVESKIAELIDKPYFVHRMIDNKLGNKVTLVIEGKQQKDKEEKMLAGLKKRLDKYEMPRSIIYLDCFSYTATGKIRRKHTFQQIEENV